MSRDLTPGTGVRRGQLRVYLGSAPGVGKTYRMLDEAHRRLDRGADVVVGFNEPVTGTTTASVVLRTPSGATVPAVVTYNATTRRATLNPNATLAARTRYTFGLGSGVRDLAGNWLTPTSWAFTTGG